jgi:hypothetical protein
MMLQNESFLVIAVFGSLVVAVFILYGAYRNRKILNVLVDNLVLHGILSNFSAKKFRTKAIICVLIPVLYALSLAEIKTFVYMTGFAAINRYLLGILIAVLVAEESTSCRK